MQQSKNNTFICALSGQSPISDPVCTPSGHICSKRLLLTKLGETNGQSPFLPNTDLDESQLIELSSTKTNSSSTASSSSSSSSVLIPPAVGTNSIPSILNKLQSEYDAIVLELFDTRKALDDTRKELSTALYQNDAAVRVIARVVLERDMARKELMDVIANGNSNSTSASSNSSGGGDKVSKGEKRSRENGGGDDQPPVTKRGREVGPEEVQDDSMDTTTTSTNPTIPKTIPDEHVNQLQETWKQLSTIRKQLKKKEKGASKDTMPSLPIMKQWTSNTKNWHKTNSKGGLTMVSKTSALSSPTSNQLLVTYGKDKHIMVYDTVEGKVKKDVHIKSSIVANQGTCIDYLGSLTSTDGSDDNNTHVVASVTKDGIVRVYTNDTTKKETDLNIEAEPYNVFKEDSSKDQVVGISIHPTGKHIFVLTANGTIHVLSLSDDGLTITPIAALENAKKEEEDGVTCTACALHPDGLIFAVGKSNGKVEIWDLKSQKLGSTIQTSGQASIHKLVFSENGYHIASSASDGTVTVWDLRKQKIITTIKSSESNTPHTLAFDPYGKFLAYGSSAEEVTIAGVKDWDNKVVLGGSSSVKGSMSGLVWGHQSQSLMTCSDEGRGVTFWSLPKVSKQES